MSLASTTLSAAVTAGASTWPLASRSGITLGGLNPTNCLWCNGEAAVITALVGSSGVAVQRGRFGSSSAAHASGATVYVTTANAFYATNPVGAAPTTPEVDPWINTVTGQVWVATAGVWVEQSVAASLVNPAITGTVSGGATFTAPTLSAPVITAPSGSGSTGLLITKSGVLTELTGDATYSITIPVPALALIHSIRVVPQALWTAATSAALIVGDTADPDGYFVSTDLKATDLVVGEMFDTINSSLWGGKEGAYLVAASGRRGPTTDNFGPYYVAGSDIVFAAAKVGTGTAGRTLCSVTYSLGETIAQVVTP